MEGEKKGNQKATELILSKINEQQEQKGRTKEVFSAGK